MALHATATAAAAAAAATAVGRPTAQPSRTTPGTPLGALPGPGLQRGLDALLVASLAAACPTNAACVTGAAQASADTLCPHTLRLAGLTAPLHASHRPAAAHLTTARPAPAPISPPIPQGARRRAGQAAGPERGAAAGADGAAGHPQHAGPQDPSGRAGGVEHQLAQVRAWVQASHGGGGGGECVMCWRHSGGTLVLSFQPRLLVPGLLRCHSWSPARRLACPPAACSPCRACLQGRAAQGVCRGLAPGALPQRVHQGKPG